MLTDNPNRTRQLISELTAIWEDSVRATHPFLKEENIIELMPYVEIGLRQIQHLIVAYENQDAIGFMGIEYDKIEMLFLKSTYIGKGIGRNLITKAIQEYGVLYVDVNEQNPHAVDFYNKVGFQVYERTELDEQGNPFPILKMKLK